jgi:hypothetical protein
MIATGKVERGGLKQTVDEVSKAELVAIGGLPTRSDETFVDSTGFFGVEFLGRGGRKQTVDEVSKADSFHRRVVHPER